MKHEKSFDKLSPGELSEISRKAGIASGRARRAKREKIEAEKIHDIAIRENRREVGVLIKQSASILLKAEMLSRKYKLDL